jgi:hypothetical protein
LLQAHHVFFQNVRLAHKPANFVHVLNDLPFALWLGLASLSYMNSVAFAGKLLVRSLATADPAVVSHPDSFQGFSFKDGKSKMVERSALRQAETEIEMSSGRRGM